MANDCKQLDEEGRRVPRAMVRGRRPKAALVVGLRQVLQEQTILLRWQLHCRHEFAGAAVQLPHQQALPSAGSCSPFPGRCC